MNDTVSDLTNGLQTQAVERAICVTTWSKAMVNRSWYPGGTRKVQRCDAASFFGLLFAVFTGILAGCGDTSAYHGPPIEPLLQSTVLITKDNSQAKDSSHGSGMIISPELVLTAYHAVRGKTRPSIRFLGGDSVAGKVIWSEPDRDLALIRVDVPKAYPVAPIYCDELTSGQQIVAVGHPLRSEWVAVSGRLPKRQGNHAHYVSMGLRIGRGASGGPVFNDQGQVVGIILAIQIERFYAQTGIGYMLPAHDFCQTIQEKRLSTSPSSD